MGNPNEKPKEDFIKSYEKIFDYVNDELKNDEENLNKQKIQYDTNEILIEKIIANTVAMFSSPEMVKFIKSLKTKLDEETLAAIINLVSYASSAAAHQAIVYYDEILHDNLNLAFENLKMKILENKVGIETLDSVMNVFKVRLDEVRQKIQIDDLTK